MVVFFKCTDVGAWLQASYDAVQPRHVKASVCCGPQTSEDFRSERMKTEKGGTLMEMQHTADTDNIKVLDGFFLVKPGYCYGQNE